VNIGIIGSGMIGGTTVRLFARAGHMVAISNSRGPASLTDQVAELGPHAHAATVEEAADFGEVVLVAIPFGAYESLPTDRLSGKIVIDATNYYAQRDQGIDLGGRTSSELVAQHLAGARLVKAFNTLYFKILASQARPQAPVDERLALFLAGDDAQAKAVVAGLIEEIGFAPIDTGSLREGGAQQQPGSPIYNRPLTGVEAREALQGRA
jgi:predicted dinucleotide-binding enzyme